MQFWQVVGNRRYLRDFTVEGRSWTAVLSWHSEYGDRATSSDAYWLLRLGPGAPRGLDAWTVQRIARFRPADLDRSMATPACLLGDAESMEVQHALRTAERYVEAEIGGGFEPLPM